jgi:hypothetical protein
VEDSPAGFVAYVALAGIVPLALFAFARFKTVEAALFTILGAVLFGPIRASFKLPLMPALNKETLAYLVVLVILAIRHRGHLLRARVDRKMDLLPAIAALGGVATGLTNTDPLSYGTYAVTALPGMTLKDGLFMTAASLVTTFLPFYVGRALIRDARDLHALLRSFAIAGLVYAPFAILEMRISPQLHATVYGYHPHEDFLQTMRMGGYRPMLFMAHGLAVALFFVVAMLAMATLDKRERIWKFSARQWMWFLALVLIACKSTGAILYGLVLLPIVLETSPKTQVRVAAVIAVFVLVYPAMRAYDAFPVDKMLAWARVLGDDRAGSLHVRFYNEGVVLEHARERLVFGWGTYGRHLVYEADSGITRIVTSGVLGLLTTMGTLLVASLAAWKRLPSVPPAMRKHVAGLSLLVAIASFDLVPNGLFANYPFLLAGALVSAAGTAAAHERAKARTARAGSFVLDEPRALPA